MRRVSAVRAANQPLFDTDLKGTRLVGEVESVRFLSPDVALMHVVAGTVMRGQKTPSPDRDSIETGVAIKENGDWRLAAFQNTRVRPMGTECGGDVPLAAYGWLRKVLRPRR